MKAVKKIQDNYNELLSEANKHQTKLNETLRHDNYELLRVKKYPEKILEQLCAEKISVTYSNKDLSQRCKYSKKKETAKDKLQSRIDSPFNKY